MVLKTVLNTFSYTGAFSVFAALGGAKKTTSVDLAKRSLAKTQEQFSVNKVDADLMGNEFINLEVRGSGGVDRVRNIVDLDVVPDIENIDGICSVKVFGGREKTVEVIYDEKACEAYGISPNQIRNYLRQNGLNRTYVGRVFDHKQAYYRSLTAPERKDFDCLQSRLQHV